MELWKNDFHMEQKEEFIFLVVQQYFLISEESKTLRNLNGVNKSERVKMKMTFINSLQINTAAYSINASPRIEAS